MFVLGVRRGSRTNSGVPPHATRSGPGRTMPTVQATTACFVLPPIRTFTVGPGISPGQPAAGCGRVADCNRRLGITPTPEHVQPVCTPDRAPGTPRPRDGHHEGPARGASPRGKHEGRPEGSASVNAPGSSRRSAVSPRQPGRRKSVTGGEPSEAGRGVRCHGADVAARGAHGRAGGAHLPQRGCRRERDGRAEPAAAMVPVHPEWFEQAGPSRARRPDRHRGDRGIVRSRRRPDTAPAGMARRWPSCASARR